MQLNTFVSNSDKAVYEIQWPLILYMTVGLSCLSALIGYQICLLRFMVRIFYVVYWDNLEIFDGDWPGVSFGAAKC